MIAGAMRALKVGDPRKLETDVGPVIDDDARQAADEHIQWLGKNAKKVCELELPKDAAHRCSSLPLSMKSAR